MASTILMAFVDSLSDVVPVTGSEEDSKTLVRKRSGNVCELDGYRPATAFHPRKAFDDGGFWCPANILHLCQWCSTNMRSARDAYFTLGWCVRTDKDPDVVPVQLHLGHRTGLYLLDNVGEFGEAYPLEGELAQ